MFRIIIHLFRHDWSRPFWLMLNSVKKCYLVRYNRNLLCCWSLYKFITALTIATIAVGRPIPRPTPRLIFFTPRKNTCYSSIWRICAWRLRSTPPISELPRPGGPENIFFEELIGLGLDYSLDYSLRQRRTRGKHEFWACWCSGNATGHITGNKACKLLSHQKFIAKKKWIVTIAKKATWN